ncbi:MAG: hypothetical protein KC656_17080 [Myxococcales bacterium]|nr:hypothetical protein [Myxococcales bacterium]MCB9692385.1 hypothetical protein [Alphaproteobacteria bacterium]
MVFWMAGALADPGAFAGSWSFVGGEDERKAVGTVVEEGAGRFNFAIRPIARSKLAKVCAIDTGISFSGGTDDIQIAFEGENPRTSGGPSDGTKVQIHGATVAYRVEGRKLTVDGSNENGGKLSVYELVSEGTMRVTHTVSSSTLGDPLSWTLTYRKR